MIPVQRNMIPDFKETNRSSVLEVIDFINPSQKNFLGVSHCLVLIEYLWSFLDDLIFNINFLKFLTSQLNPSPKNYVLEL